jgi:recombination protein RecT
MSEVRTHPIEIIRADMTKMEPQFKAALPPQISVEKFTRVAMTAIQQDQNLLLADRTSLFGACMKAAQDGLIPDGREAAFVVYNKKVKAQRHGNLDQDRTVHADGRRNIEEGP